MEREREKYCTYPATRLIQVLPRHRLADPKRRNRVHQYKEGQAWIIHAGCANAAEQQRSPASPLPSRRAGIPLALELAHYGRPSGRRFPGRNFRGISAAPALTPPGPPLADRRTPPARPAFRRQAHRHLPRLTAVTSRSRADRVRKVIRETERERNTGRGRKNRKIVRGSEVA